MTGWRIRLAGASDADALAALESAAFAGASWGEANVREGLTAPYVRVFLAFADDGAAPSGFAMWRALGNEGELLSIGAAPAQRRNGCGRALLHAVLDDARARGVAALFLEVDERNAAARGLYVSDGFTKVGERRGYYRGGGDALVMRRDL